MGVTMQLFSTHFKSTKSKHQKVAWEVELLKACDTTAYMSNATNVTSYIIWQFGVILILFGTINTCVHTYHTHHALPF